MLGSLHRACFADDHVSAVFVATGGRCAFAADYSGRALHRHPSLRQFWRDLEDDIEEEIEELDRRGLVINT